jgi:hypothetical protein
MTENEIFKNIRKLAKSDYYQMLYSQAKELHFKLFKNDFDFSHLQLTFLNYLLFYHNIYTDIAVKDVDEVVMENEIYEDAWMYYKYHRKSKEELKPDSKLSRQKHEAEPKETFQWVFKRPAKGAK